MKKDVTIKYLRNIFRKIFAYIPSFNRRVIVYMDGGICSQINQYVIGQLIARKGYQVSYDTTFFDKNGLDLTGKFVRNFDILKLYPYLEFQTADRFKVKFWAKLFRRSKKYSHSDFDYLQEVPPFYLAGYYGVPDEVSRKLYNYLPDIDYDSILNSKEDKSYASQIMNCILSCGVHVRRGDLANGGSLYYGEGTSKEYFIRSIDYVKNRNCNAHFFFFSDEIDYVEREIIPMINGVEYTVIRGNGSDKGYIDLALCSLCDIQIASVGSMGKYATLLKRNGKKCIILPNIPQSKMWARKIDGETIMIDNDSGKC